MAASNDQPRSEPSAQTRAGSSWSVALEIILPIVTTGVVLIVAAVVAAFIYRSVFTDRIYLGVSVRGVDLGGYTVEEAKAIVHTNFDDYQHQPIVLRVGDRTWQATPQQLGMSINVDSTVAQAFLLGRAGTTRDQLIEPFLLAQTGAAVTEPVIWVDQGRIRLLLERIAREIEESPREARLSLKPDQKIAVVADSPGQSLDVETSADRIEAALRSASAGPVDLAIVDVQPVVSAQLLEEARRQATVMLSGPVVLRLGDKSWTWQRQKIAAILGISEELDMDGRRTARVSIDDKALTAELELLRGEFQVEPQNARFDYADGRMIPIYAGRPGLMLDVGMAVKLTKEALLRETNREVVLPTRSVRPAIAAEDGPMLGIRDLIQEASTVYGGTLPEREHNVELAAARLHGVVVPPGGVFSFNETVGEVSYRNGYKKGYGITQSEGEVITIPSEGGGICQVATTLFQSVFWAGLPVVERNWHLYWIPRYGMAPNGITGLDATVDQVFDKNYNLLYEVDFKFQNNTGNYLLIQTEADEDKVYFRLYGTNPNWSVIVEEPVIKDEVKANPTPVREPDESLNPGEEIVLETAQDGFRVVLKRIVMRNNEVINEQTFVSTYKPSRNYSIFGPSPEDELALADTQTPGPSDGTGEPREDRPAGTPEPDSQ